MFDESGVAISSKLAGNVVEYVLWAGVTSEAMSKRNSPIVTVTVCIVPL